MTPEDVRRERLRQEKEWYLSEAGFLDFIRDCGAAPDAQQQPHGRYCQDLITWRGEPDPEAPERILYKYKLVLWPRGTFKTAAFDVGHICWLIAGNADLRIFVGSETETLSTQIVEQVMKIIDSQWFRDRFGIHKGKQWKLGDSFTSAQRSLNALKYKEPTLQALSVGVVTTGFHWDYGFMDDIHSQKNTANPEQIEKVWVWFGDMMAQLDPGSRLFMMATLHHYADTYCRIMKDPKLAALFEISVHAWSSPIIDPNSSDEADLFFPGRLTRRYVAEQKAKLTPRQYACYYENRPFSGDQQLFKPKYFQVIGDQHIPTAVWTYILTDFAFMAEEKKKGKPDRTAFWVISIDTNLVAYVRDFYVGMVRLNDSCRTLCELWNNWQHVHLKGVTIEGGVCFQTVRSMLEEIRRQTFIMPRLIEVGGRNQIEKEQRIESTEPRFRRGDIYFAQSLRQEFKEKWGPMIDEMTEWPFSDHDDVPDALSDLDNVNEKNIRLLPGPPAAWHPLHVKRSEPIVLDGRFNPRYKWPAEESHRHVQTQRPRQATKGGAVDLGNLFGSQPPQRDDLFRPR